MAQAANDIRRTILEWAAHSPRVAYIAPFNGGVFGPRRTRACPNAWPYLAGWLAGGRCLLVEIKTPSDRMRPQQEAMRARADETGALYVVARSVDDVIRAVEGR